MTTVAQRTVQWLHGFGDGKVIFKSEQGPATIDPQKATRNEWIIAMGEIVRNMESIRGLEDEVEVPEVVPENFPVGEPQANGALENAMKRIQ